MMIYTAVITLILVIDPFGGIPVFLSVLEHVAAKRRKWIILREMLIAFVILRIFLFFGKYSLTGLHITEPALGIAGGVILFLIALGMIFPGKSQFTDKGSNEEPIVVPLAIPFIAGPSTITMVILFATREPEKIWLWFSALAIAWALSSIILIMSDFLRKILGSRILKAIERLMGMLLTTLAVQMLLSGIKDFLR